MGRVRIGPLLLGAAALVTVWLVAYPLVWLVAGSLLASPDGADVTIRAYREVLLSDVFPAVARNTAAVGIGAVAIALAVGVPLAWIVGRTDTPGKGLIGLTALVPFITPPVVGAIAWAYLGSPEVGFVNLAWRAVTGLDWPLVNVYTLAGLVWVTGLYVVPYVFLFAASAFRRVDPALEHAAAVAGASARQVAVRITLPLAAPALCSGALLAFIQALELFGIAATIGIPGGIYVFTTQIWREMLGVPPRFARAAALAMVLAAVSGAALWAHYRLLRGREFTVIAGRAARQAEIRLGRGRYAALAFALGYLFLAAGLPYLTVLYGALVEYRGLLPTWDNLTLRHVTGTFEGNPFVLRSIRNSLLLSGVGATAGIALAALVAYLIGRTKYRGRRALDFLTLIPMALPGAVVAIGLLWAYIRPPFRLYGTFTILLLAYLTRFLPYGVKAVQSALAQVDPVLERSAEVCGASFWVAFRRVLVPLALPGLAAGWILMFVSMMRELPASIMLYGFEKETLAVVLFLLWDDGVFEQVSVMALIILVLSLVSIFVASRLTRAGAAPGRAR